MQTSVINRSRLAWRLQEIATATGLSLAFIRKEVRNGNLPAKHVGRAVLVLDKDFKLYLEKGERDYEGTK